MRSQYLANGLPPSRFRSADGALTVDRGQVQAEPSQLVESMQATDHVVVQHRRLAPNLPAMREDHHRTVPVDAAPVERARAAAVLGASSQRVGETCATRYHVAMMRLSQFAVLLLTTSSLACGGSEGQNVETVPASVLDPQKQKVEEPTVRAEYKLSKKEDVAIFPPPEDAYSTDSGLQFVVFKRGKASKHPSSNTNVTVHYDGYTSNGEIFDSSIQRNEPTSFVLSQVIPGWREGVKLMTVGDSFRFWIPEKDAYRGAPDKPAGLLIFDVELLDMEAD